MLCEANMAKNKLEYILKCYITIKHFIAILHNISLNPEVRNILYMNFDNLSNHCLIYTGYYYIIES